MASHRLLEHLRLQRSFARSLVQRQVLLIRQARSVPAPPTAPKRGRVPFLRPGPITRPPQGFRPGQPQKANPPRASVPLSEEHLFPEPELEIDIRFDEVARPPAEGLQPILAPTDETPQMGDAGVVLPGEPGVEGGVELRPPDPPSPLLAPQAETALDTVGPGASLPRPEMPLAPQERRVVAETRALQAENVEEVPLSESRSSAPPDLLAPTDPLSVTEGAEVGASAEPRLPGEADQGGVVRESLDPPISPALPVSENASALVKPEALELQSVGSVSDVSAWPHLEPEALEERLAPRPSTHVQKGSELSPRYEARPEPDPQSRRLPEPEQPGGLERPPAPSDLSPAVEGSGPALPDGLEGAPDGSLRVEPEASSPAIQPGSVAQAEAFSGEPQTPKAEPEGGLPVQGEGWEDPLLEPEAARAELSWLEEAPPPEPPAVESLPPSPLVPQSSQPAPPGELSQPLPEAPGVEFFRPRRSRLRLPESGKPSGASEEARAAEPASGLEAAGASPAELRQLFERLVRTWPQPGDRKRLSHPAVGSSDGGVQADAFRDPSSPWGPRREANVDWGYPDPSRPPEPATRLSAEESAPRPRAAEPKNPLLESFRRLTRTWPEPGEPSWTDPVASVVTPARPGEPPQGLEGEPSPVRPPAEESPSPAFPLLEGPPASSGLPRARAWLRPPIAGQEASDDVLAGPLALPTPLADSARRFLEPLLGFDPSEFPVYRDASADRIASTHRADGVNVGEAVFLAAGQQDDDPRTLGLLAHELTHAARRREPRFVPALLRASWPQASPEDEERVAQEVEREVRYLARQRQHDPAPAPPPKPPSPAAPSAPAPSSPLPAPRPRTAEEQAIFGNLPAPWEPLPGWLEASRSPGSAALLGSSPAPSGEGLGVQTAPQGRPSAPELSPQGPLPQRPPQNHSPTPAPQPPPDLDALAQQVYRILKRRLAAERRREA